MSKKNKNYSSSSGTTGASNPYKSSRTHCPNGPTGTKCLIVATKDFIEGIHNEEGIDNLLWRNNEFSYESEEERKYEAYINYNDDIEVMKADLEDIRSDLNIIKNKVKFIPEIKQSKKCYSIIRKLIEKLQILTFCTAVGFVATATIFIHLLDWI